MQPLSHWHCNGGVCEVQLARQCAVDSYPALFHVSPPRYTCYDSSQRMCCIAQLTDKCLALCSALQKVNLDFHFDVEQRARSYAG